MAESTPPAPGNSEAGRLDPDQPPDDPTHEPSGAAADGKADSGQVPDKQIGRWKDDGGAVDFTS
jgi:hypothetical protein